MRMIQFLLVALVVLALPVMAQNPFEVAIDNFEHAKPDTIYVTSDEGAPSSIVLTAETTDKQEGTSALKVRSVIGAFHPWGSYSNVAYVAESGTFWDWSLSESLSVWIKVTEVPKHPEYLVFRIQIRDSVAGAWEEYIYENTTVIDSTNGWINLRVPLIERVSDGGTVPNADGFVVAPSGWGGFTWNNRKLDRDKITQFTFGIVTTGWTDPNNIPADSTTILFDAFTRFGIRSVPFVFFNGKALSGNLASGYFSWGASIVLEENAGPLPKTNALKWTQGNGWTGAGWNVSPAINLAGSWPTDSIKFKMKLDSAVGEIRMQLEDGTAKIGKKFVPTADGSWHDYAFALRELDYQDGTSNFDSSAISVAQFMAEGNGIEGRVIYITDWWTGSPVFDVIAPDAPTGISATGGAFQNLITWTDTPNESEAKYNVYWSENVFTSLDDPGVEDAPDPTGGYNLPAGTQSFTHLLRSPNTDQNVSLYYGVMATDAAGNESPLHVSATATTTLAKGVPTINKTAPANFTADGNLSEWAGMTYFLISKDSLTAHVTPNMTIDNDGDLSAKAYVAFDADYLYVAFDVTDNLVSQNSNNSWEKDAPDLFIGLYDWRTRRHSGYRGGTTPDYHFRFNSNEMFDDNGGVPYLRGADSVDYAYVEKSLEAGYVVEAKLSLDSLAAKHTSKTAARFHPEEGKRLPIDFAINDNDGSSREGILAYSVFNQDNSWQNMYNWTYTWIGDLWKPTTSVEQTDATPQRYVLSQNYPNPFNPSTQIRYSLEKAGRVTLRVYDLVGREVATLVDTHQEAGSYTATFNTREITGLMSTGVYFYRLDAGEFTSIKKMVLLK